MAEQDKNVKPEKSEGKKGFFQNFLEPILDQATTEFTRPILGNIPKSTLLALKKLGVAKILPVTSIALSGLLKNSGVWWAGHIGDIMAEGSAELRRLMNEAEDKEEEAIIGSKGGGEGKSRKGIINIILNPELSDEFNDLLSSLTRIFENKSNKEIDQIIILLGQLSPLELVGFLKAKEGEQSALLNLFIKKIEEKSIDEAIKELKENLQKLGQKIKVIQEELVEPALVKIKPGIEKVGEKIKTLDDKFAPDAKIGKAITGLRSWSQKLVDEQKKKRRR